MQNNELKRWQDISNFYVNHLATLENISEQECLDLMNASCIIIHGDYSNQLKTQYATILYNIAFLQNRSLEECWQIYWILTYIQFTNSEVTILEGSLQSLYQYIFNFISDSIPNEHPYQAMETRNKNCIVVVLNQYLSEHHSATVRALDYSYAIKKHLKKEVIIINTSELNFYRHSNLEPSICNNFIDAYNDLTSITYKGECFEFYQVGSLMPNLNEFKWLIDNIYRINPLFVYNIGASNITADLCTRFTTTVSLPCSYEIPISYSKYLLVGRKLHQKDNAKIEALESYQRVVETDMGFNITESNVIYTRKQLDLDEDIFIISIIGSRLDYEINQDIINLIIRIISTSDIHIALIGEIKRKQEILTAIPKEHIDKIHFLGHCPYASKLISITNLYLNPQRLGGGRSSFESLYYGIPVVSLAFGDVYYACSDTFCVQNYDEMYLTIIKYYTDPAFHQMMSKNALLRADKISNIDALQKDVVDIITLKES